MYRIVIKSRASVEIDPSLSIVQADKTNDAVEVTIVASETGWSLMKFKVVIHLFCLPIIQKYAII